MTPLQSVEGENVACARGGRLVFRDVSFRVASGGILQVEGANGSGKTSLLRLIAGLLAPAAGAIRLDTSSDADERRNFIGWLGHQDGVKSQLTPRETLAFHARLYGRSPALPLREGRTIEPAFRAGEIARGGVNPHSDQQDPSPKLVSRRSQVSTLPQGEGGFNPASGIDAALTEVGLARVADLPCQYLSAGQKRRLALARLKLTNRPLWLLDEPLAALDAQGKSLITGMLRAHADAGGISVAATHEPLGVDAARLHLQ